jgi:hypothetical protein
VVDAGDEQLVELDAKGAPLGRLSLPAPAASVTGFALTGAAASGHAGRALLASDGAAGARLQLVDLDSGSVVSTLVLGRGRGTGYFVPKANGSVELVTYPGPISQSVQIDGDSVVLGSAAVDRGLVGGGTERLRVKIDDAGATYCLSAAVDSACYSLSSASLGGLTPGELTFAGRADDGRTVLVQKVWSDSDDFYLVLEATAGGPMRAVQALASEGPLDIPNGSRFAFTPGRDALLRLTSTDSHLNFVSTTLGG